MNGPIYPLQRLAELWMIDEQARKRSSIMMIEVEKPHNAFFDESRQDRHGPVVYAVTAYITTFKRGLDLQGEWDVALKHCEIECFHATDFLSREGEFDNNWSDDKRRKFITRLANIAAEHLGWGLGYAVRQDYYDQAMPPKARKYFKGDPYGFCLFSLLITLLKFEEFTGAKLPSPLYCLFHDKREFRGTAMRIYTGIREIRDKDRLFGDFGFGDNKKYSQLQAADLLVYETTREYIEQIRQVDWSHPVIEALNRKKNIIILKANKQRLKDYGLFLEKIEGDLD